MAGLDPATHDFLHRIDILVGARAKPGHDGKNEKGTPIMPANKKLLILAGDGIGPEVMAQAKRVVEWFDKRQGLTFDVSEGLVGGAAIDKEKTPVSDATMEKAMQADAVLLGAVGGPKWENLPFEMKPERGLLRLRKDMELFANLRPALVFDALAEASTLKLDIVRGLDILFVRELTGGVYFGEPRGIETLPNGERRGVNTQVYTTSEIIRVGRIAFELARKRRKHVTSVEKANVMESGLLWREEMTKLGATEYKDVALSHMYADNCCMQLVRQPKQFDVICTDNLFGDLLSDCAAMLTGSLGMLPSASLGAADQQGRRRALYEPVHGSAPDIAGQNKANPLASLLSLSMMLRYSFDLNKEADLLETAAKNVVAAGSRTQDIMAPGCTLVSTVQMGDLVLKELDRLGA
jgi:3-isopropylmalate dehydrogenase